MYEVELFLEEYFGISIFSRSYLYRCSRLDTGFAGGSGGCGCAGCAGGQLDTVLGIMWCLR